MNKILFTIFTKNNRIQKVAEITPFSRNCSLFSPTLYFRARAMLCCYVNISPSNAETLLLGYIAWQWDRYLVPHNAFLVS